MIQPIDSKVIRELIKSMIIRRVEQGDIAGAKRAQISLSAISPACRCAHYGHCTHRNSKDRRLVF